MNFYSLQTTIGSGARHFEYKKSHDRDSINANTSRADSKLFANQLLLTKMFKTHSVLIQVSTEEDAKSQGGLTPTLSNNLPQQPATHNPTLVRLSFYNAYSKSQALSVAKHLQSPLPKMICQVHPIIGNLTEKLLVEHLCYIFLA